MDYRNAYAGVSAGDGFIVDYEGALKPGSSRHLRFDLSPAQVEQLLSAFRAYAGHAGWKR